ncbi:hypothetical protein KC354_g99 [Hortaea werneckii]|nr:hypothetical protein KC354_g99 [Hortaea werneckii]
MNDTTVRHASSFSRRRVTGRFSRLMPRLALRVTVCRTCTDEMPQTSHWASRMTLASSWRCKEGRGELQNCGPNEQRLARCRKGAMRKPHLPGTLHRPCSETRI